MVTAFISMWITNTATTAMMTPIMEAVLKQLDKETMPNKDCDCEEDNSAEQQHENGNTDGFTSAAVEPHSEEGLQMDDIATSNEDKEMLKLVAPIHPRNTSTRGLLKRQATGF